MRSVSCLIIALSLSFITPARANDWQTDYDQALITAKSTNKCVLIDFTGSDWCGPCIQMRKMIFSRPEFLDYAKKNLVLVEIDFPMRKRVAEKTIKQNEELKQQYEIERSGFPTVILLSPNGKIIGRFAGYGGERPADLIAWIEHQRGKQ